jgi:hypothetical protein
MAMLITNMINVICVRFYILEWGKHVLLNILWFFLRWGETSNEAYMNKFYINFCDSFK